MQIKSIPKICCISLISITAVIIFTSCFGLKGGAGKSGKSLFVTFFTEDKSIQYFIKPIKFNNKNEESILCDFTFKNTENNKDSAIMNISILSKTLIKTIDSLVLKNRNIRVVLYKNQFLFNERAKDFFHARYSYYIPFIELKDLFKNNEWEITYYSSNISNSFITPKKTKSKLNKLTYEIFDLF